MCYWSTFEWSECNQKVFQTKLKLLRGCLKELRRKRVGPTKQQNWVELSNLPVTKKGTNTYKRASETKSAFVLQNIRFFSKTLHTIICKPWHQPIAVSCQHDEFASKQGYPYSVKQGYKPACTSFVFYSCRTVDKICQQTKIRNW